PIRRRKHCTLLGERDASPEHFTWDYHNADNAVGSWRTVFLAALASPVACFCRRELRRGTHFGFCTLAVAWQNGDRRAHYLRHPRNLIFPHPRIERSRLAAGSGVHAT